MDQLRGHFLQLPMAWGEISYWFLTHSSGYVESQALNRCLAARVIGNYLNVERWIKDSHSCLNVQSDIMRSLKFPVPNHHKIDISVSLYFIYSVSFYHLRYRNSSLLNEQHFEPSPDPHMIKICVTEKTYKVCCCYVLCLHLKDIQGLKLLPAFTTKTA